MRFSSFIRVLFANPSNLPSRVVKRQSDSLVFWPIRMNQGSRTKNLKKEENAAECVENCEIWGRIVFSLAVDGIFVTVLLLLLLLLLLQPLLLYFHIWGYPVCEAERNLVLEAHHNGTIENVLSPTLVHMFMDMCTVCWWNIFCYFCHEMLTKDVFSVHKTWSPSGHSNSYCYHLHMSHLLQLLCPCISDFFFQIHFSAATVVLFCLETYVRFVV